MGAALPDWRPGRPDQTGVAMARSAPSPASVLQARPASVLQAHKAPTRQLGLLHPARRPPGRPPCHSVPVSPESSSVPASSASSSVPASSVPVSSASSSSASPSRSSSPGRGSTVAPFPLPVGGVQTGPFTRGGWSGFSGLFPVPRICRPRRSRLSQSRLSQSQSNMHMGVCVFVRELSASKGA